MTNGPAARSLHRINLNQLKVLAELCLVHSVTQAADNLGVTQSAVSHVLAQLRGHFGDELFVRTGSGMTPTPLALQIAERLPEAFLALENAIEPKSFEPLQSTIRFFIACSDYTMGVLLPRLLDRLTMEAPGVALTVLPLDNRTTERLDMGLVDLVIAGVREVPERFLFEQLYEEATLWAHRDGHPLTRRPISDWNPAETPTVAVDYGLGAAREELESFTSQHGMIQWTRTRPPPNAGLDGPRPVSRVVVPNFFAAALLVAGSDYLTQLPLRLAATLAPRFNLVVRSDWQTTKGGYLAQIWRPAFTDRHGHPWLRAMVRASAEALAHEDIR